VSKSHRLENSQRLDESGSAFTVSGVDGLAIQAVADLL
jgi:hypothetical protein